MEKNKVIIEDFNFSKKYFTVKKHSVFQPTKETLRYLMREIKRPCLYLIEFNHGSKIGITSSLGRRLPTYMKPWCYKIRSITIISGTCLTNISKHVELNVRRKYAKHNRMQNSREFFINVSYLNILKSIEKEFIKVAKNKRLT